MWGLEGLGLTLSFLMYVPHNTINLAKLSLTELSLAHFFFEDSFEVFQYFFFPAASLKESSHLMLLLVLLGGKLTKQPSLASCCGLSSPFCFAIAFALIVLAWAIKFLNESGDAMSPKPLISAMMLLIVGYGEPLALPISCESQQAWEFHHQKGAWMCLHHFHLEIIFGFPVRTTSDHMRNLTEFKLGAAMQEFSS